MFLKASTQPAIGTLVRIDLELPSATVIVLSGVITQHVTDPQRGVGVDLKLEPLPTKSVWLIESALAAENKMRAATTGGTASTTSTGPVPMISDGQDVSAAETELVRALEAEAESLRKLNPFLVLGVGYETTDSDVRAAFGELTKRYHPDRFARYQSERLRQIAAEIFILIRDAYRKLADDAGRRQVLGAIGKSPPKRPTPPQGKRVTTAATPVQRVAVPPVAPKVEPPTAKNPHDAPTNQSKASEALAGTQLARSDQLAIPVAAADPKSGPVRKVSDAKSGPVRIPDKQPKQAAAAAAVPPTRGERKSPSNPPPVASESTDSIEILLDDGKVDDALAAYKALSRKQPNDRVYRAGIELCEGLKALGVRDRLEAAQRFETALEIDPSNERAARELADMRRQATNERKGLLSRLMGKKEPPP
jgi:hypothetical protein